MKTKKFKIKVLDSEGVVVLTCAASFNKPIEYDPYSSEEVYAAIEEFKKRIFQEGTFPLTDLSKDHFVIIGSSEPTIEFFVKGDSSHKTTSRKTKKKKKLRKKVGKKRKKVKKKLKKKVKKEA